MARDDPVVARALSWARHETEALCDSVTPFAHGTVYRSTEFPAFAAVNCVWVTGDPGWTAAEAVACVDHALDGLPNRLLIFADVSAGEPLRDALGTRFGFMTTRIVWMRHDGRDVAAPPAVEGVVLREVPPEAVTTLRTEWVHEDFGERDTSDFVEQSVRARSRLDSRTIAAVTGDEPIGFAAVDVDGDRAEVGAVFVSAAWRGRGVGAVLTTAAIRAAGPVDDLWISADDEDRPKALYARLGFEPVLRVVDCIRLGPG